MSALIGVMSALKQPIAWTDSSGRLRCVSAHAAALGVGASLAPVGQCPTLLCLDQTAAAIT
jgi:hypothetical protein